MRKKEILLATGIMLTTTLSGCGSAVNQILSNVDEGEYSEAVALYQSKKLSETQEENLSKGLDNRIQDVVTRYANNEIDYLEATEVLYGIQSLNINDLYSEISDALNQISRLSISKDNYIEAESAFSNEEYIRAYNMYSYVIEEDCYYADATKSMTTCITEYKKQIQDNVNEYTGKKQYTEALDYLNGCLYSGIDEVDELVNSLMEATRVESIIAEADEYSTSGDIESALELIAEAQEEYKLKDNSKLNKYKDDITTEYISMVMDKAKALSEEKNYILALNMLNTAYDITGSSQISSMIEEINKIKPIYLYDLKVSESNMYEIIDTGEALTDTVGNIYNVGNLFEIHGQNADWSEDNGYAKYYLGYKYDHMSGVVSVDDISESASSTLQIIGDDVILYTIPLNRTTTPTVFSLDVSAVNWLEIRLTDTNDGSIYAILSDFQFDSKDVNKPETTTTEIAPEDTTEEIISDENETEESEEEGI